MSLSLSYLDQRVKETLKSTYKFEKNLQSHVLIALSPDDEGVERNGGRIGGRYSPRAILHQLSKCTLAPGNLVSIEILPLLKEGECLSWDEKKQKQIHLLQNRLNDFSGKKIIHLGGGHDHIYPLIHALDSKNLSVLNLDAHADTRIDETYHSGNPFRKLSIEKKINNLFQWGLHPYANSSSTLTALPNTHQEILYSHELQHVQRKDDFFTELKQKSLKSLLVLSIDADVISGSIMSAVSAVNQDGVDLKEIKNIIHWYKNFCIENQQKEIYGIYEYNPLYDDLSCKGARAISALIWEMLK